MSASPVGPARFWYVVAGAAVAGSVVWLVLGLLLGFRSVSREVEGFQRVPVPGEAVVSFTEPGGYVLYFEGLLATEAPLEVPFPEFTLVPVGRSEEVPIRPYEGSMTYQLGGHAGRAVGTFHIDQPGSYRLRADGVPLGGHADIAVGPSIGGAIVRTVLLALSGAATLFIGGTALAVVVAVRRSRSRRPPSQTIGRWTPAYAAAPGGWFADPSGRHELRYFDGQKWTAHVSDGTNHAVDPL